MERKGKGTGLYLGFTRLVTATFGRATEIQDFVEALAWNAYRPDGLPAMLDVRARSAPGRVSKGDVLGAARWNLNAYGNVLMGVYQGDYAFDIGGALHDYAVGQASDFLIGKSGQARQRAANALGWHLPVGQDALLGGETRNLGKQHALGFHAGGGSPFRSAFADRLVWSQGRLSFQL